MGEHRNRPYTVDAVIEHNDRIALITCGDAPYKGAYALPGGHVDKGETPANAVVRESQEETGLDVTVDHALGDYSTVLDDPRYAPDEFDHTAYVCSVNDDTVLHAGDDAATAEWRDITALPDEFAYGHETIINDYLSQR